MSTTRAVAAEAKAAQASAAGAHAAATAQSEVATRADEAARTRLEDVTTQADAARVALKRADAKVDKSKGKAYAQAFTAWQMAAVADRFGHARTVLARQQADRGGATAQGGLRGAVGGC